MNAKAISEAVDADGWPIVVGCHVRVTGANRGRGVVYKLDRTGPEVADGPKSGFMVSYRDREGRSRQAWADTCRVIKATTKAKRRQELADYQLEQASKAFTRRRVRE